MEIDAQEKTEERIEEGTYYKLQDLTKLHPNNVDVIWRFARACYNYMNHFSDIEHKKKIISKGNSVINCKLLILGISKCSYKDFIYNFIFSGLEACEQFINVENADLHKWYAILIGLHGEYLPLAEKIKNGSVFKNHVMIALKLRPKDSDLHHLLGRFRYEISNLTWFERKVCFCVINLLISYVDILYLFL